jgi:hypothetical protein
MSSWRTDDNDPAASARHSPAPRKCRRAAHRRGVAIAAPAFHHRLALHFHGNMSPPTRPPAHARRCRTSCSLWAAMADLTLGADAFDRLGRLAAAEAPAAGSATGIVCSADGASAETVSSARRSVWGPAQTATYRDRAPTARATRPRLPATLVGDTRQRRRCSGFERKQPATRRSRVIYSGVPCQGGQPETRKYSDVLLWDCRPRDHARGAER